MGTQTRRMMVVKRNEDALKALENERKVMLQTREYFATSLISAMDLYNSRFPGMKKEDVFLYCLNLTERESMLDRFFIFCYYDEIMHHMLTNGSYRVNAITRRDIIRETQEPLRATLANLNRKYIYDKMGSRTPAMEV